MSRNLTSFRFVSFLLAPLFSLVAFAIFLVILDRVIGASPSWRNPRHRACINALFNNAAMAMGMRANDPANIRDRCIHVSSCLFDLKHKPMRGTTKARSRRNVGGRLCLHRPRTMRSCNKYRYATPLSLICGVSNAPGEKSSWLFIAKLANEKGLFRALRFRVASFLF